jgi:hypothetical protein
MTEHTKRRLNAYNWNVCMALKTLQASGVERQCDEPTSRQADIPQERIDLGLHCLPFGSHASRVQLMYVLLYRQCKRLLRRPSYALLCLIAC